MTGKINTVDEYLAHGCGRCSHFDTPQCKVYDRRDVLVALRSLALESGLTETLKWSQPVYTLQGKNVLLVSAFRDYAFMAFFKGALLADTQQKLVAPGPNSQASRQLRFTDVKEVKHSEKLIRQYIQEAIALEEAGVPVPSAKKDTPEYPEELTDYFRRDPELETAFRQLTPGRQRGYILYFSQAKQSETRTRRITKYRGQIIEGKGLQGK